VEEVDEAGWSGCVVRLWSRGRCGCAAGGGPHRRWRLWSSGAGSRFPSACGSRRRPARAGPVPWAV